MDVLDELEGDDVNYYGEDYGVAAEQFDQAFSAHYAAQQEGEEARAAAAVEDVMFPVRRQEDKIASAMHRAADGICDGQEMSFSSEQAVVEIMLSNGGRGPCGPPDDFGRCSSRYHDLECAHGQAVDWLASGPPASTGQAALANLASRRQLDLAPRSVWGDPDDYDRPAQYMPQRTVGLAHQLAHDWGLDATAPCFPSAPDGWQDLLRPPAAPVSVYDELADGIGYGAPPQERSSYPGIAQLAQDLGLK